MRQIEIRELLDDIHHVNQANKVEIKRINSLIRSRIAETDLSENVADAIIDEVSSQLGQLSANVKLTDKAIRSINPERNQNLAVASSKRESGSNVTGVQFSARQLAGNKNLLPMEHSRSGVSYVWSAADPETQFVFSLDRSKVLGMQLRLFALVKPEFLKQLKVFIDGSHIRHRFHVDKGLYVVSCNLPPSSKASQTHIRILLPATHSPVDLGISQDVRMLGIAISEIRFGQAESGFTHILRRLKLKV